MSLAREGRAGPLAALWRAGLALALLSVAACDDRQDAEAPDPARAGAMRRAVEAALGEVAGGPVVMRGVQVYAQAVGGGSAVCGQVNLQPASGAGLFTLFVALVTAKEGSEASGGYAVEIGRAHV